MYQRERKFAGRKAFSAKRTNVMQDPYLQKKSNAGFSNCPATSRKMWIALPQEPSK